MNKPRINRAGTSPLGEYKVKTFEQGYKEGSIDTVNNMLNTLSAAAHFAGNDSISLLEFEMISENLILAIEQADREIKS